MGRKSYELSDENEHNLRAAAKASGLSISALLNRLVADGLARGITVQVGGANTAPQSGNKQSTMVSDPRSKSGPVVITTDTNLRAPGFDPEVGF